MKRMKRAGSRIGSWTLKRERTRVTNRITSLLATVGVYIKVNANFPTRLDQ